MNLHKLLSERATTGKPVRVVLIGAGKFGSMFLAQARTTDGLHILGIADLDVEQAKASVVNTGWTPAQTEAKNLGDAMVKKTTFVTDNAETLITAGETDVVIDATGDASIGIRHCLMAIENGDLKWQTHCYGQR